MSATATINHDLEAMQAENSGHTIGCFEVIAEEIVEDAAERGVTYQTGSFSEVLEGSTILDQIIGRLFDGRATCRCDEDE